MTETVRLLSVKGRGQLIERFYFYDGEAPISDGVVEIPANRPEWVQRAYIMGYRYDPVTEEDLTLDEALAGGRKTPVPYQKPVGDYEKELDKPGHTPGEYAPDTQESAESAGVTNEGTDGGGLSTDGDGFRSSEPEGAGSSEPEGLGSGVGDGATVQDQGNDSPANPVGTEGN